MKYKKKTQGQGNGNCAQISLTSKLLAFSKTLVRFKVSIFCLILHQNLIVIYQNLSYPFLSIYLSLITALVFLEH